MILSETLKLLCSITILSFDNTLSASDDGGRARRVLRDVSDGHLRSVVPALLYTLAAPCQTIGAYKLDALSFIILSQLKLILTPVFSFFLLGQTLRPTQWACLLVTACGMVQVQPVPASSTPDHRGEDDHRHAIAGLLAMLVAGTCVALAGVWMESTLKAPSRFWARNAQLAGYSCVCAGVGLLVRPAGTADGVVEAPRDSSFFRGYHGLVWLLVILQAVGGFITAWCVRVGGALAKNNAQVLGFMFASAGPLVLSSQTVAIRVSSIGF